ncbi:MAG: glycosyltransferase [Actinomycetota bacterium]|nr:glycosyltransferase [Actinomycetota bacterium]
MLPRTGSDVVEEARRFAHRHPIDEGVGAGVEAPDVVPVPALVHDYLLVLRGAERVFAAMAGIWPEAPVYSLLYDPEGMEARLAGRSVTTSALQRLNLRQGNFRRMLPLLPAAADRLGRGRHELVVSSSSAFAHRVAPSPGGVHVCYCHSPFRYAWHERDRAATEVPRLAAPVVERMLDRIRTSDARAAAAVTHFVANSRITQQRIAEFWGRDSVVIHPPVEVDRFAPAAPEDWFLCVGELVAHKRHEAALEAARRAGVKVKVVGTGPERRRLEALYGDTAEFLGRVGDRELEELYPRARAFIVPNVEEFGIAAVEAQAAGRPVLAIDGGGVRETVVDGITGVLVPDDDAMAQALRDVDFERFDPELAVLQAGAFSTASFQAKLEREVERAWRSMR